ncbi:hypothetical protein [Pseudomonas sp. NY15354]|uniref:hypothetical protein n=1 Tax=Pseudomonas sp. NY15354 TaxID=3400351 RepID=UPI003A89B3B3
MSTWEWDPLHNFFSRIPYQRIPAELCKNGVNHLTITRNSNLKIILNTISPPQPPRQHDPRPLGDVYINDTNLKIDYITGTVSLTGLFLSNSETSQKEHETFTTDTYQVHTALYKSHTKAPVDFTIDHIANIPSHYIFPDNSRFNKTTIKSVEYPDLPSLNISTQASISHSTQCIHLQINDQPITLGPLKVENSIIKEPGYILYLGNPGESIRRETREALSFALGLPLVYFGHSCHAFNGQLIEFSGVSPHTFGERAWTLPSLPPAPITDSSAGYPILNASLVERIANGLLTASPSYNLSTLPWRLWYAESSPYFMKPAYYGALIEALQRTYLEVNHASISSTIIPKPEYRKIRKLISRLLEKQEYDPISTKLLSDKLNHGNDAPQRIIASRFYAHLDLELGDAELSAWNKRNDAAHGNKIPDNSEIAFIRETKILKNILNRILLKITNGSDHYIDYFTLGHPTRHLTDSIPD